MGKEQELKAIRLLQERAAKIGDAHAGITSGLDEINRLLRALPGAGEIMRSKDVEQRKAELLAGMGAARTTSLERTNLAAIYDEAEAVFPGRVGLRDILTDDDFDKVESRVTAHVLDFNRRYGLDEWDYAIAGSCGLFAAMLDILCVRAPPKPTTAWNQKVDGIFNKGVQASFNKLIPPELSEALSKSNKIGAADSRTMADLIGAPAKALNPTNHRLRSLAHDPLLGFIFGVLDMRDGACTTVVDGTIQRFPSVRGATEGSLFQLLGQMLGHLLSDVNARSGHGNRGMGLPAPFMGLLRMFECIVVPTKPTKVNPSGISDFGKQIEFIYMNGYDFRHFVATNIPMAIMEVIIRAFYVVKQMKLTGASFGEAVLETVPGRIHPRFRTMLALAYGTTSAVNAGKVCATNNLMDLNYASWMGLTLNGFHALKWILHDRPAQLWGEFEANEIDELETLANGLHEMVNRAAKIPIQLQ